MPAYPTSAYLMLGDGLVAGPPRGPDVVPSSGDYLNLLDEVNYLLLRGGLTLPPVLAQAPSLAGAAPRMRSARALPNRLLTLHLTVFGNGTDAGSVWANWRAVEHKLEQARAASGPLGHGAGVVLALRMSTAPVTKLQFGFVLFDVLDGRVTPVDLAVNPSGAYGMTLELQVLPYGRLPRVRWPGVGIYTATVVNTTPGLLYVGTTAPSWASASPAVGSIGGTVGALARLHVLDKSTAGAINRIRVGRRSVPGAGGGMAEADWAGISNCAAIGSAVLQTGQSNAIGSDFARLAVTDGAWHDLARATSGTPPKYASGIYDVWARVRESAHTAKAITDLSAAVVTLSTGPGVLIPDTYTIRLAGQSTSPSNATAELGNAATVSTAYPWTPNIFQDGFERGDASAFELVSNVGAGLVGSQQNQGEAVVAPQWALAGAYGLRSRGLWNFSTQIESTTFLITALVEQAVAAFTAPDANPLAQACWLKINGGGSSDGFALLGLYASVAAKSNPQYTYGGSTPTYHLAGDAGGLIGEVYLSAGVLSVRGWNGPGLAYGNLSLTLAELSAPMWVRLSVNTANLVGGGTYTLTLFVVTITGTHTVTLSCTLGIVQTSLPCPVDSAAWGVKAYFGSGSADVQIDDCLLWTSGSANETPNQGIRLAWTDPNNALPTVYVQQGEEPIRALTAPSISPATLDVSAIAAPVALLPSSGTPAPAQFRARISPNPGSGSALNPLYGQPVSTALQDSQWQVVNLGTLTLPPASAMAGLGPLDGSASDDFGWQIDVQGASGAGSASNTLDVDAVWLFPHDEPQFVAEFPGLGNTALLEWVFDTRKDGRAAVLLRDASGDTLGLANSVGMLLLAPGNQSLLLLVERENGVHDVAATQLQLALSYAPLVEFFTDAGSY